MFIRRWIVRLRAIDACRSQAWFPLLYAVHCRGQAYPPALECCLNDAALSFVVALTGVHSKSTSLPTAVAAPVNLGIRRSDRH